MNARTRVEELFVETRWLVRLARTLVGDAHAAEDLAQDAWCAGLDRRARPREMRAWLAGAVRKLALRRRRDEATRARREACAARAEAQPNACSSLEQAELQRKLLQAVLALEEPYRRTVLARFFEGAGLEELARREGVPGSTVRTWNQRALERLRHALDREHGGREAWSAVALAQREPLSAALPAAKLALVAAGVVVAIGAAATLGPLRAWRMHASAPAPASAASPAGAGMARHTAASPSAELVPVSTSSTAERTARPSSGRVEQPLSASWRLSGIVSDPDGAPIAGAEVLWRSALRFHREDVVVTGADGRYAFAFASGEDARAVTMVAARHPLWLPAAVRVRADDVADGEAEANLALGSGASVRFFVADEEGSPVRDAKVRLRSTSAASEGMLALERDDWDWRDWAAIFRGERLATAWTDATGACSLAAAAPGANELLVWAEGYRPEERASLAISADSNAPVAVTLARGRVVRGSVRDAAGAAVAGARVYACVSNERAATTSGLDGAFQLGGLCADSERASVCVVHPAFAPYWAGKTKALDARLKLDGGDLAIVLDQGRTLELQLVDGESGTAVAGPAALEIERVSPFVGAPVEPATRERSCTLASGRLVAERIGVFVRSVWLTCPGYDPVLVSLADPATGTGELVSLRPSRRFELEIVAATTGAPVAGASLAVGIDTSTSPELPSAVRVDVSRTPGAVHGDRITFDSAWLRWGERWTLAVSAPGFAPWSRATTAEEMRSGPDLLRVELERSP